MLVFLMLQGEDALEDSVCLEVNLLEPIGRGCFGSVWRGIWQGAPVAVKHTISTTQDTTTTGAACYPHTTGLLVLH